MEKADGWTDVVEKCPLLHVGGKWVFFFLFWLVKLGQVGLPGPGVQVAQWCHKVVSVTSPTEVIPMFGVSGGHLESELLM